MAKAIMYNNAKQFESKDFCGCKVIARYDLIKQSTATTKAIVLDFYRNSDYVVETSILEFSFGIEEGGVLYWDWEEVKQPVTFQEALDDCEKTGQVYMGEQYHKHRVSRNDTTGS